MAVTTIPANLSIWVSALPLPPVGIIALICLMFFVGGCFLDAMALIMLTIPIIYPVILQLNYDPIWFGVVIVLISQIAVVTPPVGVNVYVTKGIVPDVPIAEIFRGTFPFLVAMFVLLVIVTSPARYDNVAAEFTIHMSRFRLRIVFIQQDRCRCLSIFIPIIVFSPPQSAFDPG